MLTVWRFECHLCPSSGVCMYDMQRVKRLMYGGPKQFDRPWGFRDGPKPRVRSSLLQPQASRISVLPDLITVQIVGSVTPELAYVSKDISSSPQAQLTLMSIRGRTQAFRSPRIVGRQVGTERGKTRIQVKYPGEDTRRGSVTRPAGTPGCHEDPHSLQGYDRVANWATQ